MKNLLRFTAAITLALVAVFVAPAFAAPDVAQDTNITQVVSFDPVTFTSNVAITYPSTRTFDTGLFTSMRCELSNNNDGGDNRVVTPKCYHDRLGTKLSFSYPTLTVATNAQGAYVFDPRISAATADTGVTDSPNRPCRFMRFTAPAAKGNGTFSCTLFR